MTQEIRGLKQPTEFTKNGIPRIITNSQYINSIIK